MCVIIHYQPGQMLPIDMLENAIANNWHGYGLIVKTPKKLTVLKEVPKDFDNPNTTRSLFKEIHDLLKKYVKYERVIHLRHKTEGDVSEENCHPFKVFDKENREVWFAHNGTMYEYRANAAVGDAKDNRSDSKIFADKVLSPLLDLSKDGDYSQYIFKFALSKFWGGANNMGVLVSNDLPTYEFPFPEWKSITVKNTDGADVTIRASNDSYFKEVKRGPIFEENKKKKEEQERSFRNDNNYSVPAIAHHNWPLSRLRDIDFQQNNILREELIDIMDHIDLYTNDGLADLANLMPEEIDALVQDKPEVLGALFMHLSDKFAEMYKESIKLVEKHSIASKMVAELKKGATIQ